MSAYSKSPRADSCTTRASLFGGRIEFKSPESEPTRSKSKLWRTGPHGIDHEQSGLPSSSTQASRTIFIGSRRFPNHVVKTVVSSIVRLLFIGLETLFLRNLDTPTALDLRTTPKRWFILQTGSDPRVLYLKHAETVHRFGG